MADRERLIQVRRITQLGGNEFVPGYRAQGLDDGGVADRLHQRVHRDDVPAHHLLARLGERALLSRAGYGGARSQQCEHDQSSYARPRAPPEGPSGEGRSGEHPGERFHPVLVHGSPGGVGLLLRPEQLSGEELLDDAIRIVRVVQGRLNGPDVHHHVPPLLGEIDVVA